MAEIVRMPKLSDTMTEGVISKWLKKVGDKVKSGAILAEIDSDKATMEFESFYDGTLLYIGTPDKKSAPVDSILAIIGKEGEDVTKIIEEEKKKTPAKTETKPEAKKEEKKTEPKKDPSTPLRVTKTEMVQPVAERPTAYVSESSIKASPLAKKLAKEKNLKLSLIAGSGDEGRVTKRDIENYLHFSAAPTNGKAQKESSKEEE